MRTTLLAVVVGCLVFVAANVQAAPILDGKVIQVTYLFPTTSAAIDGPTNVTVGPGIELADFAGFADIDISNTNILITAKRDAGINDVLFDGFRFFDVGGTIADNLIATLNPATTYAGFTESRLAGGDNDTLLVNVANLAGLAGQVISIDINPPSTTVPEPATATLLASALVLLVGRRRSKASRSTTL